MSPFDWVLVAVLVLSVVAAAAEDGGPSGHVSPLTLSTR